MNYLETMEAYEREERENATPHETFEDVDFDTATQITIDISMGVEPKDSERLTYGPGDIAWYNKAKASWEKTKKKNPKAYIHVFE